MTSRKHTPPRHRGAPLGNTNALKHGFYAKKLRSVDITDLEHHAFSGLSEEILTLRVFIRRLIEISNNCTDPAQVVAHVRVLSLALISLTRLLRTEQVLGPGFDTAFSVALREVTEELGIQ